MWVMTRICIPGRELTSLRNGWLVTERGDQETGVKASVFGSIRKSLREEKGSGTNGTGISELD